MINEEKPNTTEKDFIRKIGKNFAKIRKFKKIKKKNIVLDKCVSMNTMNRLQNGENISLITLFKLSNYLGVDVKEFFN